MNSEDAQKKLKTKGFIATGKAAIMECRQTFKEGGFRAVIRRYGWKIFAAFFAYYLVRDLTLYVLIPYLVAKHFLN